MIRPPFRARSVPQLRAEMLEPGPYIPGSDVPLKEMSQLLSPEQRVRPYGPRYRGEAEAETAKQLESWHRHAIASSHLYWIEPALIRYAWTAEPHTGPLPLREMFNGLADYGLCVFGEPIEVPLEYGETTPITAASWAPMSDIPWPVEIFSAAGKPTSEEQQPATRHDPTEPGNPYTHWAYFENERAAHACAEALPQYRIRIDPPDDDEVWLLRAERNVPVDGLSARHREVEHIVEAHGGDYDGGESTFSPEGIIPAPELDVPTTSERNSWSGSPARGLFPNAKTQSQWRHLRLFTTAKTGPIADMLAAEGMAEGSLTEEFDLALNCSEEVGLAPHSKPGSGEGWGDSYNMPRALYIAFLLARSPRLGQTSEETVARSERRRAAKRGVPYPDGDQAQIRTMSLRPAARDAVLGSSGTDRTGDDGVFRRPARYEMPFWVVGPSIDPETGKIKKKGYTAARNPELLADGPAAEIVHTASLPKRP